MYYIILSNHNFTTSKVTTAKELCPNGHSPLLQYVSFQLLRALEKIPFPQIIISH